MSKRTQSPRCSRRSKAVEGIASGRAGQMIRRRMEIRSRTWISEGRACPHPADAVVAVVVVVVVVEAAVEEHAG